MVIGVYSKPLVVAIVESKLPRSLDTLWTMAFEKSWWSRPRASSLDEMDADAEKRYLFEEMQALNSFRMRDVWTRGFEPRLVLHSVRRGASCFRIARFAFVILAAMCIEMYIHNQTLTIKSPAKPVDAPFHVGCVEPDTRAPRENGVIVMLANNNDLSTAMRTIGNFEQRFNGWYGYPYVLFNDQPWDPDFISTLTSMDLLRGRNVTFETLASNIWGWPEWMTEETKKSAQAAMHDSKVMYAGKESYHHMCRFFAG